LKPGPSVRAAPAGASVRVGRVDGEAEAARGRGVGGSPLIAMRLR